MNARVRILRRRVMSAAEARTARSAAGMPSRCAMVRGRCTARSGARARRAAVPRARTRARSHAASRFAQMPRRARRSAPARKAGTGPRASIPSSWFDSSTSMSTSRSTRRARAVDSRPMSVHDRGARAGRTMSVATTAIGSRRVVRRRHGRARVIARTVECRTRPRSVRTSAACSSGHASTVPALAYTVHPHRRAARAAPFT